MRLSDISFDDHYRRLAAMYASAPIHQAVPCRAQISDGASTIEMQAGPGLWHAAGALHGSMYFKALDDAAFFAANSVVMEAFVLTASFEIELLAPVTSTTLRAEGKLEEHEGRTLSASSELFVGDDLVARGRGVFIVSRIALDSVPSYRDAVID